METAKSEEDKPTKDFVKTQVLPLKEQGSLKKGSIRVDMEELDLEETDFERLKQRISFVLEDQISTMKDIMGNRALDVEGSIIWVDMKELDLEEIDEGLKQKIALVLKERIIAMKDLKEQRALQRYIWNS